MKYRMHHRRGRKLFFGCARVAAMLSLFGSALLWYWSYSGYEVRYIRGNMRWGVGADLRDGIVSLQLSYCDGSPFGTASVMQSGFRVKKTNRVMHQVPVLIKITPSKNTVWGGFTNYGVRIDAPGSFLFVIIGVLPVGLFVILPAVRKYDRIELPTGDDVDEDCTKNRT